MIKFSIWPTYYHSHLIIPNFQLPCSSSLFSQILNTLKTTNTHTHTKSSIKQHVERMSSIKQHFIVIRYCLVSCSRPRYSAKFLSLRGCPKMFTILLGGGDTGLRVSVSYNVLRTSGSFLSDSILPHPQPN